MPSKSNSSKSIQERMNQKSTYKIGKRTFVVETVFNERSANTLGTVLLRLMRAERERA